LFLLLPVLPYFLIIWLPFTQHLMYFKKIQFFSLMFFFGKHLHFILLLITNAVNIHLNPYFDNNDYIKVWCNYLFSPLPFDNNSLIKICLIEVLVHTSTLFYIDSGESAGALLLNYLYLCLTFIIIHYIYICNSSSLLLILEGNWVEILT